MMHKPLDRYRKKNFYYNIILDLDKEIKEKIKTKKFNGIFKLYVEKSFYIDAFRKVGKK